MIHILAYDSHWHMIHNLHIFHIPTYDSRFSYVSHSDIWFTFAIDNSSEILFTFLNMIQILTFHSHWDMIHILAYDSHWHMITILAYDSYADIWFTFCIWLAFWHIIYIDILFTLTYHSHSAHVSHSHIWFILWNMFNIMTYD